MISNITNALPALLKAINDKEENIHNLKFNLVETIKFFSSILPKEKGTACFKHMFLDCVFYLKEEYKSLINDFNITMNSFPFLKDFDYELNPEEGVVIIRSNYEELAILSLILMGSIKDLKDKIDTKNKSIFISLAFHFLTFCVNNGYNVCKLDDIKVLEEYNDGFDKQIFENISFIPTPEERIGTIHFVGIDLNKDILKIFETYKNVKFTYNEENASFIISMNSKDWDDFWQNAPQYLKNEFTTDEERKQDIR